MMKKKTIVIIIVNVAIFITIGIVALLFLLVGKPFMQGFYCDDTSIAKPYRKSTVPIATLFIVALILAFICFTTAIWRRQKQIQAPNRRTLDKNDYKIITRDALLLLLMFLYGCGLNMFITDVGKYSIGRLRPHYLAVCQPDWSKINCTDKRKHKNLIIGDKICRTTDQKALKEAHLSFPSGHSSFSGFVAVFLILYLENQVSYSKSGIVPKYFLQTLIAVAAFYVGLSRVTDYFHHPTDVLAGFGIGLLLGILMHVSLVRIYYPKSFAKNISNTEIEEIVEVDSTPINVISP